MTTKQVQLVQESWQKVLPIAKEAGQLFYGRLFEIAPEVRGMFKADISDQSKKLMGILAVVISKLDKLDTIIGEVRKLGARHNKYRVQPEHYQPVAEALLWTLEQGLGETWNKELKEAWTTAYMTLAGAMIEAQKEEMEVVV